MVNWKKEFLHECICSKINKISLLVFFKDFVDRFGATYLDPFVPNSLFPYPLKILENRKMF